MLVSNWTTLDSLYWYNLSWQLVLIQFILTTLTQLTLTALTPLFSSTVIDMCNFDLDSIYTKWYISTYKQTPRTTAMKFLPSGMSDLGPKWVRLTPNRTNPGIVSGQIQYGIWTEKISLFKLFWVVFTLLSFSPFNKIIHHLHLSSSHLHAPTPI